MNKIKNGSLKYLSIENCIGSYANLKIFLKGFYVSEQAAEMWYGDKKIAKDMVGE